MLTIAGLHISQPESLVGSMLAYFKGLEGFCIFNGRRLSLEFQQS